MVNITEREGIFYLEGQDIDIKIDNNRKIYVKKNKDNSYTHIGTLEVGYTGEEKKKYMYNLYNQLVERKSEIFNQK